MKVRMFCDWDNDSEELIRRLKDQTDAFQGNDFKGINFVSDDSYTHAVVFNFPTQDLKSPPQNNIALVLEPPELVKTMWKEQAKKKYTNVRAIYSFAADEYEPAYGMGFATVPKMEYIPLMDKNPRMCMICSDKLLTPYHQKRRQVMRALLETDFPIDFYGRGMTGNDSRIKGEIPSMRKNEVLNEYMICIDFENSPHSVVTDKFFDPVLCNTIHVSNAAVLHTMVDLDSFFFVSFDLPVKDIVETIGEILETEINDGHAEALLDAKREIMSGDMCLAEWIARRMRE
jgi:hypothetical protein